MGEESFRVESRECGEKRKDEGVRRLAGDSSVGFASLRMTWEWRVKSKACESCDAKRDRCPLGLALPASDPQPTPLDSRLITLDSKSTPSDSRLNALDSKPTPLNCLGCERLTSKQVGYKKIHRSQFIDITVFDKYTEFDPNMKINYKQIGCEISYG